MSYKARAKSEGVEEDGGKSLMCAAHGCPLRWSVSTNSACTYHAWEETKFWPAITERLHREGPWERKRGGDSPTVADMKTRLRPGHRFTLPEANS